MAYIATGEPRKSEGADEVDRWDGRPVSRLASIGIGDAPGREVRDRHDADDADDAAYRREFDFRVRWTKKSEYALCIDDCLLGRPMRSLSRRRIEIRDLQGGERSCESAWGGLIFVLICIEECRGLHRISVNMCYRRLASVGEGCASAVRVSAGARSGVDATPKWAAKLGPTARRTRGRVSDSERAGRPHRCQSGGPWVRFEQTGTCRCRCSRSLIQCA